MKVTLADYTQNTIQKIGQAAAICYDGKTDFESNIKRAVHCQHKGHLTVNRFADELRYRRRKKHACPKWLDCR